MKGKNHGTRDSFYFRLFSELYRNICSVALQLLTYKEMRIEIP